MHQNFETAHLNYIALCNKTYEKHALNQFPNYGVIQTAPQVQLLQDKYFKEYSSKIPALINLMGRFYDALILLSNRCTLVSRQEFIACVRDFPRIVSVFRNSLSIIKSSTEKTKKMVRDNLRLLSAIVQRNCSNHEIQRTSSWPLINQLANDISYNHKFLELCLDFLPSK